jgi:hypothetical protein
MYRVRRSVFARSFLLPLALLIWLSACMNQNQWKWEPLEPPFEQAIAERQPGTVRATLSDGEEVVFKKPLVSNDSLTTYVPGPTTWDRGMPKREKQYFAIPLEAVDQLEERHANEVFWVSMGVFIAALTVGFIALAASDFGWRSSQ